MGSVSRLLGLHPWEPGLFLFLLGHEDSRFALSPAPCDGTLPPQHSHQSNGPAHLVRTWLCRLHFKEGDSS